MSTQNRPVEFSTHPLATKIDELVINWHITEACNFNCGYCFAKWGKPNELHRSLESIEKLLDSLANYFIHGYPPIKQVLQYENVRLNIAGGEPMMLGSTFSIVLMLAKQKGFRTSVITNGHYLLNNKFDLPANVLDMVGISFDSQSYDARTTIGRGDRKGNSISSDDLKLAFSKLRSTQRGLKTKVNTVVNKLNWEEDFSSLMLDVKPDKWKVLQVMPYGNDDLLITDEQFNRFLKRHENQGIPIFPESNLAMTESYLMIDPKGRFYQNLNQRVGYVYSNCINYVGCDFALKEINFNSRTFLERYSTSDSVIKLSEGVHYGS